MTTLNVNEGASSSAGSHNELSSLLPTNSELAINPITEIDEEFPNATISKSDIKLITDAILGRTERTRLTFQNSDR